MALSNTQRDQLNAAAIAMFGVPMGGYSGSLEQSLVDSGGNLSTVLNTLAATPYFQSQYAGTPDIIASKMAGAYGFSSVTGGLGQQVKDFFLANLQAGATLPALFILANDFLMSTTNPVYADAKALLLNKISVANFYTYGVQGTSQDLSTLQQVLSTVGVSASTVISAQIQLASAAANAGSANLTVTYGTANADVVTGTNSDDNYDGLSGNDSVDGAAGNDRLVGGIGNDTLAGGLGQDTLVGGSGNDLLMANSSNGSYDDYSYVYNGSQYVRTYTGDIHSEVLLGGDGADTLYGGSGSDVLDAGGGADYISGDYRSYYGDYATDDQLKAMYNDTILGGDGADTIDGGYGVDYIDAGTGDDRATLGSGGGYLDGGNGNDTLYGSAGNDTILGGAGDDSISNYNSRGDDFVNGGDGNDSINYSYHSSGNMTLIGGAGNDTISIYGGSGNNTISAGDGIDVINLGNGNYTIDLTENVSSVDAINVNGIAFKESDRTTISTVSGFNVAADVIDIARFNLWGQATGYDIEDAGAYTYDGTLRASYVQKVNSPSTPLQDPTGSSYYSVVNGNAVYNTEYFGKGILIITGASASAADATTVAAFINPYGNNATYSVSESHYFVVDIAGQGAALYRFEDDTDGNNNIVADELAPMVLLTGVSAASLNDINFI